MKTKFITTTIIAVLAIIVATTTTATNVSVKASNNCSEKSVLAEIACRGQEVYSAYEQGIADGRAAALDDDSDECPQSDSLSGYCIGFGTGYKDVKRAQDTLNQANGNNNNDDNNNGDDGELVPQQTQKRTIQQSDAPKRTIGGN